MRAAPSGIEAPLPPSPSTGLPATRSGTNASDRTIPPLLAAALVVAGVAIATQGPSLPLTIPALLIAALACVVRPAAVVCVVCVLTAAVGSLVAFTGFTPLSVSETADRLLLGLWLGVVIVYLSGRAKRSPWLWAGLLAPALYLGASGLQALLTSPRSLGIDSFNNSAWYMLALVLAAIAPWSPDTHRRIARGLTVVALGVGTYACFRLAIGAAAAETLVAKGAQPSVPQAAELRFFSSFLSANQLAAWAATVIPFCLALALVWRGWWRLIGFGAVAGLLVGVLASEIRTGLLAVIAGVGVVLVIFRFSPALKRPAASRVATLFVLAVIGSAGYAVASGNAGRYARLVSPESDYAYSVRVEGWNLALDAISEQPWGYGLGTVGFVAQTQNPDGRVGPTHLDSSYLKLALEQGIAMMVLFVLALVGLLVGLARRARPMREPPQAALAAGACGTLAALLVLFYAGLYIEGQQLLPAWIVVGLGIAQVTLRPRPAGPGRPQLASRERG